MPVLPSVILKRLSYRRRHQSFRQLTTAYSLADFCSNDYLGLARSPSFAACISDTYHALPRHAGSTGSRLISGNTKSIEDLEHSIAEYHGAEAGLIFNSGYDANIGLFSSLPQRGDLVLYDELIHASIRDGIRLSYARAFSFRHNDMQHLKEKISGVQGNVYVAVESIYSMDGDTAPLETLSGICKEYGAYLIVDEAHATGITGPRGAGMVSRLNLTDDVFARIHTFGKALGCHGAIVLGCHDLRNYLINYARSFIYTTALPPHSYVAIQCAYKMIGSEKGEEERKKLLSLKTKFIKDTYTFTGESMSVRDGAIFNIIIPGNQKVQQAAEHLQRHGLDVRPVMSPTVPAGKERLRITLHSFNTTAETDSLTAALKECCSGK